MYKKSLLALLLWVHFQVTDGSAVANILGRLDTWQVTETKITACSFSGSGTIVYDLFVPCNTPDQYTQTKKIDQKEMAEPTATPDWRKFPTKYRTPTMSDGSKMSDTEKAPEVSTW